jgi:hypothetical protein
MSAIHEVLKGRPYVTPLITKDIVGELPGWMLGPGAVSGELTDRQREVVQLVAEGRSIKRNCGDSQYFRQDGDIPQVERDAKTGHPHHCRIDEIRSGTRHHRILTSTAANPGHPFRKPRLDICPVPQPEIEGYL